MECYPFLDFRITQDLVGRTVWNTVYIQAVIDQLAEEGYEINENDLIHISSARYEHINQYGIYRFDFENERKREGLRPLRSVSSIAE